jgi:septum formation protein
LKLLTRYTDETRLPDEAPEAMALRLSEAKARAVSSDFPDALIIGSDQVATVNGEIYGKPGNHERAISQLRALSGKTVNFFTGLSLFNCRTGYAETRGVATLVTFRELTEQGNRELPATRTRLQLCRISKIGRLGHRTTKPHARR